MVARLLEKYRNEVAPGLREVSMGIADAHSDKAKLEAAQGQLARITGQQPIIAKAKKSVSNFKLRRGYEVGLKVTLRGERMYEFLDRLISLAIPRVRDFRGLSPSSFDGRGNYNMGLVEQTVFPEIDPSKVTFTQGMNIAMQTSARTDEEARELLGMLGMPFRSS